MPSKYKNIEGWFDFQTVYDRAVETAKDGDVLVEIGSWKGMSACYMAELIKESDKKLRFYCIDTWCGMVQGEQDANKQGDALPEFTTNLEAQGLSVRNVYESHHSDITAMVSDSTEAAGFFHNKSLHFVFVDDDHGWKKVESNIIAWYPKVKDGGVLAGHDYPVPALGKTVRRMLPEVEGVQTSNHNDPTLSSWYWVKNKEPNLQVCNRPEGQ